MCCQVMPSTSRVIVFASTAALQAARPVSRRENISFFTGTTPPKVIGPPPVSGDNGPTVRDRHLQQVRIALAAVWDAGGRRFATFEDADDDERFVQYIDGQLNVSWPFDRSPDEVLLAAQVALPGASFVIGWTPRGTAQLAIGDLLLDDAAALIVRLLTRVLDAWEITDHVDDDR